MNENIDKYKEIINLPHHVSSKYKAMPVIDRAAQFAPYAALVGYGEAVEETERLTDSERSVEFDNLERLNEASFYILSHLEERPCAAFVLFIPDRFKQGGSYQTVSGVVVKYDFEHNEYVLEDGTHVNLQDCVEIRLLTD